MKAAQEKSKQIYDRFRVTYEWDGEDLRILAKDLNDIALTTGMAFMQWHVHVSMAKLMGWLVETGKDKYALGPNLRYELLYKTQEAGNYYRDVKNTELYRHNLWRVEAGLLQSSQVINWRFSNLNVAFRQVVGEPSRTFLVYLDLVEGISSAANSMRGCAKWSTVAKARAWHTLNPCTFSGYHVGASTWTSWRWKSPRVTEG